MDSDDFLKTVYEQKTKQQFTVRQIYQKLGEQDFRRLEAESIHQLLHQDQENKIIALGGGALSNPFLTESDLQALGFICCLDIPDPVAYERILKQGLPPFLQQEADPFRAFCEQNRNRREIFQKHAHIMLKPADFETTPRDMALHILSVYKETVL